MFKKNKECKNCDNCKKYQEKAFELEVDEDLQQERLNRFWQKYRGFIYIAVVLILAATAGVQVYQSWRMKVRLAESDAFESAVTKIFAQKPDEARPVLQDLAVSGRTGYKYLARLELAGLAVRQNDMKTALAEFKTLINSKAPETLKSVATLSYIGHQIDTGDTKELLKLVEPQLNDAAFVGIAAELATILYLRDKEPEKAKNMLKKALQMPNLSEVVQKRLKDLIVMVENA